MARKCKHCKDSRRKKGRPLWSNGLCDACTEFKNEAFQKGLAEGKYQVKRALIRLLNLEC